LASLLKLIGHMPVVSERTHQVGSDFKLNKLILMFKLSPIPWDLLTLIYRALLFAGHYNIFVGDLSPEVTDATLFACFSVYTSCS